MIDHSPHAGLKGEVSHLWATNRPLAVTILVGIAVLAYYLYKKSQTGSLVAPAQPTTGVAPVWSNTYVTENNTITTGTVGTTDPINSKTNQAGNTGNKDTNPTATGKPIIGSILTTSRITPIIPYNQLPPGTRYSNAADLQAQPNLTWMGVTYKKVPGSNDLLWGQPVSGGPQVLLYGPAGSY